MEFWRSLVQQQHRQRLNTRALLRKAKQAGLTFIVSLRSITQEQAASRWAEAKADYVEVKKRFGTQTGRQTFLEGLADAQAKVGNLDKEKQLRALIHREHQRMDGRKIKAIFKPTLHKELLEVEVLEQDQWQTYSTKEEVEQACLDENVRKFTQAHNTPFYKNAQLTVDPCAIGPTAIAILQGQQVDIEQEYVSAFILQCKQQTPTFPIPSDAESHSSSWKHMREQTASGLSGLHFGHFMAAATSPLLAEADAVLSPYPSFTALAHIAGNTA
jgi:hypothetical protein